MITQDNNTPAKAESTEAISARFLAKVEQQFQTELGESIKWSPLEKTLAQHLYIKIDASLKALETKRLSRNNADTTTPMTWANVNMTKLALDAVHRIALKLDALIDNHIHVIPFWNGRLGKYDLDLRIGYVGKHFTRMAMAMDPPTGIEYHLVHKNDRFVPHFRDANNAIESYEFEVTSPFDRGEVLGGFGYIWFGDDSRKNRLILVDQRDFNRAKAAAQSQDFWGKDKSEKEMQLKTVVHRTTAKIALDPTKINAPSMAYIEAQEMDVADAEIEREVAANANGKTITIAEFRDEEEPRQLGDGAGAVTIPIQTSSSEEERVPVGAAEKAGY